MIIFATAYKKFAIDGFEPDAGLIIKTHRF